MGRKVLNLDVTDDPVNGEQEDRFFHSHHGTYSISTLQICRGFFLGSRVRSSNIDESAGVVEKLERIISEVRSRWLGDKDPP